MKKLPKAEHCLLLTGILTAGLLRTAADEPAVSAGELPRIPATEPARALSTFRVKPGFRFELVAAEPLVVSPVAMCFDENGRLFVAEMIDYSERREEHLGRICMLEDTDGDGRMDKSTVFAEGLPWPTALFWSNGGLYVGSTPDIFYFKDTDGDGVADEKKTVFTGFGSSVARLNVQQLFNSFNWTLDNRIQGATGGNGGSITRPGEPGSAPLDVRSRDFSFDPRTLSLRPENGGGQHGLSFDNYGRKFVCSNSSHIMQVVYEERYSRPGSLYSLPRATVDIPVDGPAAEVYRISPDEPWRVLRTKWRVAGLVPGPIEGGGRPSGYFTGATGATVYRGDAFSSDYLGDVFVADCGSNLIHHKKLHPNGVEFKAERSPDEQKVEFIASTDNWFRPVQFANAPDGALYVADMYREVIEHPWSLPENIKKHVDLNSGNNRGRIYRIVPDNFRQPPHVQLGKASTTELVVTLESPNGWTRDTASRLLYERQDMTAIPLLHGMVKNSKSPFGRLHALYVLNGLNALTDSDVLSALKSSDPGLRENAVRLVEFRSPSLAPLSSEIWSALQKLSADPEVRVRAQLAWTLGQVNLPKGSDSSLKGMFLGRLLRNASDHWEKSAALSSMSGGDAMAAILFLFSNRPLESAVWKDLARVAGADSSTESAVRVSYLLKAADQKDINPIPIALGLNEGLQQQGLSLPLLNPEALAMVRLQARAIAISSEAEPAERLDAVALLGLQPFSDDLDLLQNLLTPQIDAALQTAAIEAIAAGRDATGVGPILKHWKNLTPPVRERALDLLASHSLQLEGLLHGVEQGQLPASSFSLQQIARFRKHSDPAVRELTFRLFGKQDASPRAELIAQYAQALQEKGNPGRGQKIYLERCASCHRLAGQGNPVGPNLESVRQAGKEALLTNIIDPNREVAPRYVAYDVETKSGDSFTGVILNETSSSIQIRGPNKFETTISRGSIAQLSNSGKSLMPEGLEQGLTAQDMAGLLSFILAN